MEYCQPRPAKGKWVREAHEVHGNCPGDLCTTAADYPGPKAATDWCTAETPCPTCDYWMRRSTPAGVELGPCGDCGVDHPADTDCRDEPLTMTPGRGFGSTR